MNFFEDPKKTRTAFTLMVVIFSILILSVAGVLGYLCYRAYGQIRSLNTEKATLEDEYQGEIDDLTAENGTLTESNTTLQTDNADYAKRMDKIDKYNIFLDYANDIIIKHHGFTGWTTAEFNVGEDLAEATGNAALVSAVNNAWYNYDGDPITRVTNVYTKIIEGIDGQIK